MNNELQIILTDLENEEVINGNGIQLLNSNYKLFDKSFCLGSVSSRTFGLNINKNYVTNENYKYVLLKKNNTQFAIAEVDKLDTSAKDVYKYELTDAMVDFEFNYDASLIFVDGKTTVGAILQNICDLAGITLATTTFDGDDIEVSWYDNRVTARQYISMIAELNGGFARINSDGELELVKFTNTSSQTIDLDECEDFTIGEYHKITRVVYDNGLLVVSYGDETGNTLYLNTGNVFINDEETVEMIYNSIKNFEFYSFTTTNCPIYEDVLAGDIITFSDGTNDYPTIAQYETDYFGKWNGHYELDVDTEKQEETKVKNQDEKYTSLKVEQDREKASIKIISEEQTEQGTKIATLEQSVDQIQTEIQDIPTITAETSGTGTLHLEDLIEMKLISLKIHPTNKDIIGLFASTLLKVKSGLKTLSRGITFDGDIDTYYKIPDNLYFYDENTYDEFVYDGKEEKIYIIKRVEVDGQGNKSILSEQRTIDYEYQDIIVSQGDYNIFMDTYPSAYIYVKAMIDNDYTTFFATSYEVDSKITQTADAIELEVNKKVDEDTFNSVIEQTSEEINLKVSKNEVISSINQSAEEISINANKINLNGAVTANNNVKINTNGTLEAVNGKFSGTINGGKVIVASDYDENDPYLWVKQSNNVSDPNVRIWPGNVVAYDYSMSSGGELARIRAESSSGYSELNGPTCSAFDFQNLSLAEKKKDFELLKSGLDIIKNIDIYKFRYNEDDKKEKKKIGVVIGEKYNYSKEITSKNNDSINLYSFVSVCCKAIKEQQEIIENLQSRIEKLEKGE